MLIKGIYPTMITPYRDGRIDFENVERLLDFYIDGGCTGVFAVCQSSEMNYLSLDERVELARRVVEYSAGRLAVVASGHIATSLDEQAAELNAMAKTGIDALVLVSNRLDIHNDGDEVWLKNAEKLLSMIDPDIPLGIYECPMPYKRLLSYDILEWCKKTGRFAFIKDTCCDPDMLSERLIQLEGSGVGLFNANAQTLHHTLVRGGAGYSGIMANFHPYLLSWLFENYEKQPEKAELVSDFLSMAAFTENPAYPNTAKYYLTHEGFDIELYSRSKDAKLLTSYQELVMDQLYRQSAALKHFINAE